MFILKLTKQRYYFNIRGPRALGSALGSGFGGEAEPLENLGLFWTILRHLVAFCYTSVVDVILQLSG